MFQTFKLASMSLQFCPQHIQLGSYRTCKQILVPNGDVQIIKTYFNFNNADTYFFNRAVGGSTEGPTYNNNSTFPSLSPKSSHTVLRRMAIESISNTTLHPHQVNSQVYNAFQDHEFHHSYHLLSDYSYYLYIPKTNKGPQKSTFNGKDTTHSYNLLALLDKTLFWNKCIFSKYNGH